MQLQELKQRATGNMDETFLSPGINEKQPLHVMMVRFDSVTVILVLILIKECKPMSIFQPAFYG